MANVFVYGGVAIAAGGPANRQTPNLAKASFDLAFRISFFYLSVLLLLTSIQLLLTNTKHIGCISKLGLKPNFKLSLKFSFKPKSN